MNYNTSCGCDKQTHCPTDEKTGLADYSPKDKPWNNHRANADVITGIYAGAAEFERLASRVSDCSGVLGFAWADDRETGESRLKLKKAQFCRVRYCPVCQWRRSLMWQARFYEALPKIVEQFPKSRWLFLTLTVRNCEITDLADTLKAMNTAWNKFIKRAELKPVQGWIRTTEVTKGDDRSAHPHFHCLMMVPPSWFRGQTYVKQARFVELWQESLRVNYAPNVDVRTVKAKKGGQKVLNTVELLQGAVAETLKYSTKADDLKTDKAWFLELTRQTHKKRFLASGGVLKDILKADEETNADLIGADGESLEETGGEISFEWKKEKRQYHKKR